LAVVEVLFPAQAEVLDLMVRVRYLAVLAVPLVGALTLRILPVQAA
jgi:hypothetical protein